MLHLNLAAAAALLLTLAVMASAAPVLKPTKLRCEYKTNPLAVAEEKPRLSWVLASDDEKVRGQRQTGYRVLVASSMDKVEAGEGDLWDSGKTAGEETIHIEYAGRPLKSGERAFWTVKVWNGADEESPWADAQHWAAALLDGSDWKAKWIGYDEPETAPTAAATAKADPLTLDGLKWVWTDGEGDATKNVPKGTRYFAKTLSLPADAKIARAVFLLTADDNFSLYVGGQKVGGGSGHTRAHEIDITKHLRAGDNLIGIEATNGGDNPAALCGRLVVWTAGGDAGPQADATIIDIDSTWRFSVEKPAKWDEGGADLASMMPAKEIVAVGQAPWGTPHRQVLDLPPPPYLRKAFVAGKKVTRATIYATALGLYELHLNGRRIGDDLLSPGWTDYRKRVHYHAYDVTDSIRQGDNVIGAILGDGWYAGYFSYQGKRALYGEHPRLRVQLELRFDDGSTQSILTDGSWKAAYGPEREADLLMGTAYDARRERRIAGWTNPDAGFDDSQWKPVLVDEKVRANVEPHPGEPVKAHERIAAKAITEPAPGSYVFDLGQNIVGHVRLKLKNAKRGTKVTLRHAEMLNPDGTLYLTALRGARAMDTYIANGGDEESWEPRFTFHGFRYVEISGLGAKPDLDAIAGVVVHTAMERAGQFDSSHALVNRLYENIIWGQKGNYLEVPTDCPQRDERLGWTGDAQFFINTATKNFDVAAFMKKWLVDLIQDAQHEQGTFHDVAPDVLGGHGNVAWGDAAVIIPHALWRTYGDTRIISDHYDALKRYLAFLEKDNNDLVRGVGAYGDWLNLDDKTKPEVIGTAYFSHIARLMSEMAEAIDRAEDAKKYADLADRVRAAWIKNFLQADGSILESGQTGYALAFTMDLLPADRKQATAAHFQKAVERKGNHLATGFIGTPRLLPGLTRAGLTDTAYRLFLNETFPSWLFQVKLGATTMWERWDGWTPDKGFQDPGMNSFNHYAFGSVGEWMFRSAAGIETEGGGTAFKKIIFRPRVGEGLDHASATYDSIRGTISSSWKRGADGKLTLSFTLPPNTTATAYLPSADPSRITESGKPVTEAKGVRFLWTESGHTVLRLESGNYTFECR